MKPYVSRSARLLVIAGTALASCQAMSQTTTTVKTVDIEQGQHEIDLKAGTIKQRGDERETGASIGIGYGVTQYWFTKISADYTRQSPDGTSLDEIEWENKFRLTPPDRFPLDVGLLTEIGWGKDRRDGYRVRLGPLFQKKINAVQLNANVLFDRYFSESPSRDTELSYQWQAKYEWKENLEFGVQGFGEVGPWKDWAPRSEQLHLLGPVLFGKVPLSAKQKLEYSVAYLIDPSRRNRTHGLRFQVEYLF